MLHDFLNKHEATGVELASVPCPCCGLLGSVSILADLDREVLFGWVCPRCFADREPHPPTPGAPAA